VPRLEAARVLGIVADHAAGTPTIILTSSANKDAAIECLRAGATGYAIKEDPERIGLAAWRALEAWRQRAVRSGGFEAMRESEERYRQLIDSAHDWVWEVDADGVYTYAGPQVMALLGYDGENLHAEGC
jgi:PAS domain-containing protein